jgi:hypothetical protein
MTLKNWKTNRLVSIVLLFAVIAILAAWYFQPKTFLQETEPSNVSSITVFDGNTGNDFVIEDESEIQYIVENIQSIAMKKENVSLGYMGYGFRMNFNDNRGKEIDSFIINGTDTIRDDPFFYRCNGDLCFEYLKELEDKYVK